MRNFVDKIIIIICAFIEMPLPVRIQKAFFSEAKQIMFRYYGMCEALSMVSINRYKIDIGFFIKYLFPIFNSKNFALITGNIIPINDLDYWCQPSNTYDRIKFLNWCYNNVDSYDRRRC